MTPPQVLDWNAFWNNPIITGAGLVRGIDDATTLGTASKRFSNLFAAAATISGPATFAGPVTFADGTTINPAAFVNVKSQPYGAKGDGTTDDTAAFAAAISANSGGVILVPSGTFLITSTLNLPAGTTLLGGSKSSSLLLNTGTVVGIQATGTDVTVDGLNISGNLSVAVRIGYARCTVRNCRITGCVQPEVISGVCAAILCSGADDVLIEHNYCYGNGYTNGGASSIFDICLNVQGVPSTRGIVRGNHCLSTLIVNSIACYDVDSTTAVDNVVTGGNCFSAQAGGYGILFYKTISVAATACHNNSVINNLVYGCQGSGIYMQTQYRCIVMGNRVHDVASVQDDTSLQVAGIAMAGTPFSVCSGNRVENSGKAGISIGDTASTAYDEGLTVSGNTVLNATSRPGIFIRASLLRCSITGNTVENCQGGIADLVTGQTTVDCVISSNVVTGGTGTVAAIQLSLATRVTITGNTIFGAPTYGIYCVGGNFNVVSDNVVWDCSQTTVGGAYGIQVSTPDSTINGNVVGNTSGSAGVSYCILVNAANCVVMGNRCKNGTTEDLNISGSGTYAAGNSDRHSAGLFNVTAGFAVAGNQVSGPRITGWTVQTTSQARADMGASPTLATVASTLAALIEDLRTDGKLHT